MRKTHKNEIAMGLFIIAAAAILGYLSLKIGGISIKEGVQVQVILDNAAGLVKDADVAVSGVKVGRVKDLRLEQNRAVLSIVLEKEAGLRKDVKASIRAKSLLGEKYLALLPGSMTAPFLVKGDEITEAEIPLEIDQLISSMGPFLKEIDPEDIGIIVKTLSSALKGKSETIQNIITNVEKATEGLRDMVSENRPRIEQMIENMDTVIQETASTITSNRPALERSIANVESAAAFINRKAPELAEDFSIISANLRTVSESLLEDYPKYSGRIDQASRDITRITNAFSEKSPQMAEDTASAINNISAAAGKLPLALDNFNQLAPDLKKVLQRADSVLEKTNNITYDDIWKMMREVGVKINFR